MAGFFQTTGNDIGRLLLRIALGAVLLFHGIYKLTHGVEWVKGPLSQLGLPGFLAYGLYLAEIVAPILIMLGLITRLSVLVVAIDMIMAFVLMAWKRILTTGPAGGWGVELEFLILFAALVLFFTGSGKYGISKGRSTWG